jgi:hypothetical protein
MKNVLILSLALAVILNTNHGRIKSNKLIVKKGSALSVRPTGVVIKPQN